MTCPGLLHAAATSWWLVVLLTLELLTCAMIVWARRN